MNIVTVMEIWLIGFLALFAVTEAKRDEDDYVTYNLLRSVRSLDGIKTEQDEPDGFGNSEPLPVPEAQASTGGNSTSSTDLMRQLLPPGYNMHEIPKHKSGRPFEVLIQLNIRKILAFDEPNEYIKTDIEFRVFWTDYKIRDAFNARKAKFGVKPTSFDELTPADRKKMTIRLNDPAILDLIWKPNLFFGGLLKVTQPYAMAKPVTLKFIPDIGAFEYLSRITVTTDCPMNFHYYPADTQDCRFSVRSFSYTNNDVKLKWYKTGVWIHELETANFDIKAGELGKHNKIEDDEDPVSEHFEVYDFHIKARRRLSYHVVQTYLPSTFYIVITCLCFLLPSRYVEARIGIAMTTLLTLTAMFAAVRESTPQVSYVKAIDIWMAGSIMFVFLTLAEFTFITWLRSVKEDYEAVEAKKTDGDENGMEMEVMIAGQNSTKKLPPGQMSPQKVKQYETLMIFLEKYNFPIFMSILIVFSIIYWIWLLSSAEYFDWEVDERFNNVNGDPW